MHRLRKKSDSVKSQTISEANSEAPALTLSLTDTLTEQGGASQVPLITNDFRASLILPELSHRFSLLRSSTGDSVKLDLLRTKLREQRERGSENQITEEEEEMIFSSLRFRSKYATSSSEPSDSSRSRQSHDSNMYASSVPTSVSSSPSSRSPKRNSNNLFGSVRFRDYTSLRSAVKVGKNKVSFPSEISQANAVVNENPHSTTPDDGAVSSLVPSGNSCALSPHIEQLDFVAHQRISSTLGPSGLKRASLALGEVIKEIEEDQIVISRIESSSRITPTSEYPSASGGAPRNSDTSTSQSMAFQEAMAVSPEKSIQSSLVTGKRVSPIPARTLPGYIPGMPRPMTPRDAEPDDRRPCSTTPRATPPIGADTSIILRSAMNSPSRFRRDSTSSQSGLRSPHTPLFLQRSPNGRFTPEESRRPTSPLFSTSHQPTSSSRPSTPSNAVWTIPKESQKPVDNVHIGHQHSDTSYHSSDKPNPPIFLATQRIENEPPLAGTSSLEYNLDNSPASEAPVTDVTSSVVMPPSSTPTQMQSCSSTLPDSISSKRSSKQTAPSHICSISSYISSPLANASRSSLESEGSSYHTWEGEDNSRWFDLVTPLDASRPVWHDLSDGLAVRESEEDDWDPEEYILRHAGLQKADFHSIHETLVNASLTKDERPDRAASSLRRRRRSVSQSNYSVDINGREQILASSPTPTQVRVAKESSPAPDKFSSPSGIIDTLPPSPKTLRNRDLARALFGKEDCQDGDTAKFLNGSVRVDPPPCPIPTSQNLFCGTTELRSVTKVPYTSQQEAKFAKEVQQRVDAATFALKSSANCAPTDPYANTSRNAFNRKRIDPNQISNPRLVSASSSMETVPIVRAHSISSAGSSKLGSRFRRLRGTLRVKNVSPSDGCASPTSTQMMRGDSVVANLSGDPVVCSAMEPRFKVSIPSPPASAAPGLKGFMARLRGKPPRNSECLTPPDVCLSPRSQRPSPDRPLQHNLKNSSQTITETEYAPSSSDTLHAQIVSPQESSLTEPSISEESDDTLLLKQFFDAASKVGIDQEELNALLARKGSLSANKTRPSVTGPFATPAKLTPPDPPNGSDHSTRAATLEPGIPVVENDKLTPPNLIFRDRSAWRHSMKSQDTMLRPQQELRSDSRASSAIIRRTIIFPDSKMTMDELTALMGKSSSGRRRGSFTSMSSRSVHERAPTPPPRSPTSKRFSRKSSPPVPALPSNLISTTGIVEKLNSPHDSGFDTHVVENGLTSMNHDSQEVGNDVTPGPETGAGVEVIQLANGETIWNIVNGLRDGDGESCYDGRGSFDSEFTADGVQVFVREHGRTGSQGSMSSFTSRLKAGQRPETKVFYSPSSNIGRLIEDLSQGMDAGSFNFLVNQPPSHSPSSSLSTNDVNLNLEQRLDEMIQTVKIA